MNRKTKDRTKQILRQLTNDLVGNAKSLAMLRELQEIIVDVRHDSRPEASSRTVVEYVETVKPDPQTEDKLQKLRSTLLEERARMEEFFAALGSEVCLVTGEESFSILSAKLPRFVANLATHEYMATIQEAIDKGRLNKDQAAFRIWQRAMNNIVWFDPPTEADEIDLAVWIKGFAINSMAKQLRAAEGAKE